MPLRFWSLPVARLLATERCRVAAPWFLWSHGGDESAALRRLAVELECTKLKDVTALESAVAATLYLPLAFAWAWRALRRWGGAMAGKYGVPRHRQLWDLLCYAWRLGLAPRVYYQLRLHRHHWRDSGRHVFDQPELHHLQRHISPVDIEALEDKVRFAGRARAAGLPYPAVLAIWRGGSVQAGAADGGLPPRDVFVKRAQSFSSAGVMGFRYDAATGGYRDEQRDWTAAALRAELARQSQEHCLLVQPWLENRADLRGFSASALCNFRIVTGRDRHGDCQPIAAAFRFPWASRLSCAEPGITLCSAVDIPTGRLCAAEAKDPSVGQLRAHPVSGQQIEGFVVADWRAMLDLAIRAHASWPEFPFVGWDIAATSEGLYVLEGGPLWGAMLSQMSGAVPLGLTAFPALYVANLPVRCRKQWNNRLSYEAHPNLS